jgi:16S rRNA (guanine527-N7)-methyltransferase
MKDITTIDVARVLGPYGIHANPHLCEQVRSYIELLLQWNQKISFTTVAAPLEIVRFHFGESLFAASAVPIRSGRLADVGSGAGFPGIPLRMLVPQLELTLIESNFKKAAFLSEVVRALQLDRVHVVRGRMDALDLGTPPFDFITARALGQHDDLLSWSKSHLAGGGKVVLWIGEDDAESISKNSDWNWQEPVRIPGSKRRCLLIGSQAR